jgi:oligopeptide/dipeptide ABC transporter ATP-binding protein
VADEPVSALDISIQAQIINLMQSLKNELGLTYLFISHDLSVIRYVCDRVAVMYLGEIVEIAPTQELYSNPKHPYTQALLNSVPVPDPNNDLSSRIILKGDLPSSVNMPSGCKFHTRCPYVMDICHKVDPEYTKISENHIAKCHLLNAVISRGV